MRSVGSTKFMAMGGDPSVLSARYCCSESSIYSYRTGRRAPGRETAELIHAAGGPAPEEWLMPAAPTTPRKKRTRKRKLPAATQAAVEQQASELMADAVALRSEITSSDYTAKERVRMFSDLSRVMSQIGKLTGETSVSMRQLLASPAWARARDTIVGALSPWPDAMRAVADALGQLDGGHTG